MTLAPLVLAALAAFPQAPDYARELAAVEASKAALRTSDLATARGKAAEAVDALLAREAELDAAGLTLLDAAGVAAMSAQDARAARRAFEVSVKLRGKTRPTEDPALLSARTNLAAAMGILGDFRGARAILEDVVAIRERTLAADDLALAKSRGVLAYSLAMQGETDAARPLQEQVLAVLELALDGDHPDVTRARAALGDTLMTHGDVDGGLALLEKVLEVSARTLHADHPELARARLNYANALGKLGRLAEARDLQEQVVQTRARILPPDHLDLAKARIGLAATLFELGDRVGARKAQEQAVEALERTLPPDDGTLAAARGNLARTLYALGDYAGSRALLERVLEVFSRTRPEGDRDLRKARGNLGEILRAMGDTEAARALLEKAVESGERELSDDDPGLQNARGNLAIALLASGELDRAREMQEKILDVRSRTLAEDAPEMANARMNLGVTMWMQGDVSAARVEFEGVLGALPRLWTEENINWTAARVNLATAIAAEQVLAGEAVPAEEAEAARARCAALLVEVCHARTRQARRVQESYPARQAEEICANLAERVDFAVSIARGYGIFAESPEAAEAAFELAETTRGAAIAAAKAARRAARSPRYAELRKELVLASDELAAQVQKGATSESFEAARGRRERAERELIEAANGAGASGAAGAELTARALAQALGERAAAAAFRRIEAVHLELEKADPGASPKVHEARAPRMIAFVVRGGAAGADGALSLVDLGPIEPIEHAVRAWRVALGASEGRGIGVEPTREPADHSAETERAAGAELRKLLLDPLLPAIGDRERVVLELDDVLHLVAFDALPLERLEAETAGGIELVGDRWHIETRTSLGELLDDEPAEPQPLAAGEELIGLLAIGGVTYDEIGKAAGNATTGDSTPGKMEAEVPVILRGSAWSGGFDPLPATRGEVEGIARSFAEAFGKDATSLVLDGTAASKERFLELAPRARFLHIATHGWFARESIRSWSDPEPIDARSGLGTRRSGEQEVAGMNPMLLCGLALAGANRPEDASGRAPGLITAEEIAALDLSRCELAVLSACDTNVGERRAGQGVASLQRALHMAGARTVMTSLWKVPDEATKELMVAFYRGLWVDGEAEDAALWAAKQVIRKRRLTKDGSGRASRNWAAWILTGDG